MKRAPKTPPLPRPVQEGPVEPPKARGRWWVYLVMLVFIAATTAIVVDVFVVGKDTKSTAGTDSVAGVQQEEKVYSYLSVVTPVAQSDHYTGSASECALALKTEAATQPMPELPKRINEPVYFLLNVEIKDLSEYQDDVFIRDFERLKRLVAIADDHHIPLTIGLQTPFTDRLQLQGATELNNWTTQGHEIAIRYDGATSETPYGEWLSSLHDLRSQLEQLCNCEVTSWSGGDEYLAIFDVAHELAFQATYGWSDEEQSIPEAFAVTNPWTPAGGGSVEALEQFDPDGTIVFLPSGVYPAHCVGSDNVAFPISSLNLIYTTAALYETLRSAVDQKINVFTASLSLNAFAEVGDDEAEFTAFDGWLTDFIDPLVSRRWLRVSTVQGAAQAYVSWVKSVAGTIEPVYVYSSDKIGQ